MHAFGLHAFGLHAFGLHAVGLPPCAVACFTIVEESMHTIGKRIGPKLAARGTAVAAALGATILVLALRGGFANEANRPMPVHRSVPASPVVGAIGRLEPEGTIIHLTPSTLPGETPRVSRLLVVEGDRVRPGQVLAVLDFEDRLQVAVAQAQAQVEIARARLTQVLVGAKSGDLAAQRATIVRLEDELRIARTEYDRYRALQQEGAVAASVLDSKRLAVETTTGQLAQARSLLGALAEVRPTDVREAKAQLESARLALRKAEIDLTRAYVRAPATGQVLLIHAHPGEDIGTKGLLDMGDTDRMNAVAEVHEDDVARVRIGQTVRITSLNGGFEGALSGTVYRIVPRIGKQDVLGTDPAADVDARVAEVRIQLASADSRRVRAFSNLKVQAEITGN